MKCAQNIDNIRVAVHAFIVYRDLGFEIPDAFLDHADNLILCYINYYSKTFQLSNQFFAVTKI